MNRRRFVPVLSFLLLSAALAGCSLLSETPSVPVRHPEELTGGKADCSECHSDVSTGAMKPYDSFRHTRVFVAGHGAYARQGQNLCSSCHEQSFCLSCHGRRDELLPAVKEADRPDRNLPHRGDYLTRHRIEGRIDPGSCIPCHGNKETGRCRACHR
jgi:hypothetical protein